MNSQAHAVQTGDTVAGCALERLKAILDPSGLRNTVKAACMTFGDSGIPMTSCEVARVHPRGENGFVVDVIAGFENGSTQALFAEVLAGDPSSHLRDIRRKVARQASRCGIADGKRMVPIHVDSELGVFIRPRGDDELIDGIITLRNFEYLLDQIPPDSAARLDGMRSARLLSHRLNRRAVIGISRADDAGGGCILKLYKMWSAKAQRAVALTGYLKRSSFGAASPIRVPETLGFMRTWPGYLMSRASGLPLSDLDGEQRIKGMRLAGHAIGRLHRLPLRLQESHGPADECALLRSWVSLVGSVIPTLRRDIGKAWDHVERLLADPDTQPFTLVHRDFHETQVLISGATATLIDFDTACNGEPALDIGNFLAHLDFASLAYGADCEAAAAEFLRGYAEVHCQPDTARVDTHRRATLLRLACIYAFSSQHGALAPCLAARALEGRS
jgi:Ser/Thr protein kinase RdoA (MazF antagonist)